MEELYFTADVPGIRIDRFLSDEMPDVSRSHIQKLIKEHLVSVNENQIKSIQGIPSEFPCRTRKYRTSPRKISRSIFYMKMKIS